MRKKLDRNILNNLNNNRIFLNEVSSIQNLMKSIDSHIKLADLVIYINNKKIFLTLEKRANGTIRKMWQFYENEELELVDKIDDREMFEIKTEKIIKDAEFGESIRNQIIRGDIEVVDKKTKRKIM